MGLVSVLTRWVPRTVLQRGAHLALQSVAWSYAGNTLEDPIVGKSYRKMLPTAVCEAAQRLGTAFPEPGTPPGCVGLFERVDSFFTTQGKMLHPRRNTAF